MVIGISGRKQHGKDTVGKIINILLNSPQLNNNGVLNFLQKDTITNKNWQIKKFADKLKDIVCLLIGCTREQLEDESFKNTVLEGWGCWEGILSGNIFLTKEEAEKAEGISFVNYREMTPRLMMQLIGTECGREIIYPDIWVKSTFVGYKTGDYYWYQGTDLMHRQSGIKNFYSDTKENIMNYLRGFINYSEEISEKEKEINLQIWFETYTIKEESNWIITDTRFPNELEAIRERGGFVIRVERDLPKPENEHTSESALDEAEFDFIIDNNEGLEELIQEVRNILTIKNLLP